MVIFYAARYLENMESIVMKQTTECLWCNSQFSERPETGICPQCGYNHFKEVNMKIDSDVYPRCYFKNG